MIFDDYLGLAGRDWSPYRLILFHGRSGSGKSTAIRYLLDTAFRNQAVCVIDEITTPRDLLAWRRALLSDATKVVATHIHPAWFLPFGRCAVLHTDRDEGKIARHLQRHGIGASAAAIAEYVRRFGATYTDVELILERFPAHNFDAALSRFLKFDRMERR